MEVRANGMWHLNTMRPQNFKGTFTHGKVSSRSACSDDLSAFGSSMAALAPAVSVMAQLTRWSSLM